MGVEGRDKQKFSKPGLWRFPASWVRRFKGYAKLIIYPYQNFLSSQVQQNQLLAKLNVMRLILRWRQFGVCLRPQTSPLSVFCKQPKMSHFSRKRARLIRQFLCPTMVNVDWRLLVGSKQLNGYSVMNFLPIQAAYWNPRPISEDLSNVFLRVGMLEVSVAGVKEIVRAGETLRYRCDRPHIIHNVGSIDSQATMVCILKAAVME